MAQSATNKLKERLEIHKFHFYNGGRSAEKFRDRTEQSFTFLGNGWVEVYERCYPSREGWWREKVRVTRALYIALI